MDKLEYNDIRLKEHKPFSKNILGIEVYAKKEEEKMSFTDKMFKYDYKNIKRKENDFSEAPLAFELFEEKYINSYIKAYERKEND